MGGVEDEGLEGVGFELRGEAAKAGDGNRRREFCILLERMRR
jgi:hypothetical protein